MRATPTIGPTIFDNNVAGRAVYATSATTYGPGSEPASFTGATVFVQGGADYAPTDITNGNAGFKTSDNNYGYVIFNWTAATDTMEFVSGAYETVAGQSITVPAPVPLPAALPMLLVGMGGLGLIARRRKS